MPRSSKRRHKAQKNKHRKLVKEMEYIIRYGRPSISMLPKTTATSPNGVHLKLAADDDGQLHEKRLCQTKLPVNANARRTVKLQRRSG